MVDIPSHTNGSNFDPSTIDDRTLHVLWAAMQAMVNDVHAPQDVMKEDQWQHAEAVCEALDREVNRRLDDTGETEAGK